jgi:hypothetical protein
MNTNTLTKKINWLRITPLFFAMLFCIIMMMIAMFGSQETEGLSSVEIMIYFMTLIISLVIDLSVKKVLKNKVVQIWLIELLVIGCELWFFGRFVYA